MPTAPGVPVTPRQYSPPHVQGHSVQWSTGLCHCCDDPANCLITCCCPYVTFEQVAEITNRGTKSCASRGIVYAFLLPTDFACLYSCFYRSKMRGQYHLEEAPCVDCLVHCCCEVCAFCRLYRELKNRGFDMGIGNSLVVASHPHMYRSSSVRKKALNSGSSGSYKDRPNFRLAASPRNMHFPLGRVLFMVLISILGES